MNYLKVPVVRAEPYRRLVASLPCVNCGIEGASQAAHPNSGKAKGLKACDLDIFPLCHEGANGCHRAFDNYKLCTREEMPELERRWKAWTRAALMELADQSRSARRILERLGLLCITYVRTA